MMGQQSFILLIAIVCITLAHGATKLKKKDKKPAQRQGLDISLESKEAVPFPIHEKPIQIPEHPMQNGDDQKLDSSVYIDQNRNDQYPDQDYDGANLAHMDKMEKEFEDDDEDGFFLDMDSAEYDSKEMLMLHGKGTRGLEAGDVFTAQEMLPIAVKLMNRAKSNGKGRGIVSSETNPKSLADNLFEKYFWKNCEIQLLNGETVVSQADDWCNLVETTDENQVFKMKRIVLLKDEDISGLDALQALALSGTVNSQRSRDKYIGPDTDLKVKRDGKEFPDSTEIAPRRRSRYRLLTKPFYNKIRRVPGRRGNYHAAVDGSRKARMVKKRKLVVDPKRRRLAKKIKNRKAHGGQPKNTKRNKIGRQGQKLSEKGLKTSNKMDGSKTKRFCRWKYGCEHELVLETCRLSMDCSEDAKSKDYLGIKLLPNEKRENLAMLRTWAGVDVIDSEVEKIFENRYNQQIYSKLGNIPRSESIADYFNNLIHFQKHEYVNNGMGSTTPMYSYEDSGNPNVQPDSDEESQGDTGAPSYGLSGEDAEVNGLSGEESEMDVVQLNAELIEPSEGHEGQAAEPGLAAEAAEPGMVIEVAEHGNVEEAPEPGIVEEAAEPGIAAEAEKEAEEGAIELEPIHEEVAATELADTEKRRKFLSNHKTTKNLKSI